MYRIYRERASIIIERIAMYSKMGKMDKVEEYKHKLESLRKEFGLKGK